MVAARGGRVALFAALLPLPAVILWACEPKLSSVGAPAGPVCKPSPEPEPCLVATLEPYVAAEADSATPAASSSSARPWASGTTRSSSTARLLPTTLPLSPRGDDGGCEDEWACRQLGRCTKVAGGCALVSDADCKRHEPCAERGACSIEIRDGADVACVATSDQDCARSSGCRERGACSARDRACSAQKNDDCAATSGCQRHGMCTPQGGTCVIGANDCARTEECRRFGACASSGWSCAIGGPDDCRRAEICKSFGLCSLQGSRCIAKADADCKRSKACKDEGFCRAVAGVCALPP